QERVVDALRIEAPTNVLQRNGIARVREAACARDVVGQGVVVRRADQNRRKWAVAIRHEEVRGQMDAVAHRDRHVRADPYARAASDRTFQHGSDCMGPVSRESRHSTRDSLPLVTPLELILALLVVVLIVVEISGRIGVPYPILLVIGGLLRALLRALPRVELEPDLVLLVFLPPLIFIAAYNTP